MGHRPISYLDHRVWTSFDTQSVNLHIDHVGHVYVRKQDLGSETLTLDEIMLGLESTLKSMTSLLNLLQVTQGEEGLPRVYPPSP